MRLLLIDDDAALGEMLSTYLAVEGFTTTLIHDGSSGVTAALSGDHDFIILDIMMHGLNGLDALREIRKASDIPVIMLTARGDHLDRVLGLEMGADDYVPKPYDPRELLARIRAVFRRRPLAANTPTERLVFRELELHPSRRKAYLRNMQLELTASEFNVLEVLMRARGEVRSKDEISLEALGKKRETYDRSLDVHISNIRQKLSTQGLVSIEVETVRGIGYRLGDDI